jgi:hypothetical protein
MPKPVRSYRWMAEISYLTGRPTETVSFEEIADLDNIIELGPDWNEIDQIVVTLNRPTLTTKQAEARAP